MLKNRLPVAIRPLTASRTVQVLGLANIFFLVVLIGIRLVPPSLPEPELQTANEATQVDAQTLLRSDLIGMQEIVSRPLFHMSRRPQEVIRQEIRAAPVRQATPPSQLYRVSGIVQTPSGERLAYVLDQRSGESIRLKVGDILGDWTLSEIEPALIVLESADQVVNLPFND